MPELSCVFKTRQLSRSSSIKREVPRWFSLWFAVPLKLSPLALVALTSCQGEPPGTSAVGGRALEQWTVRIGKGPARGAPSTTVNLPPSWGTPDDNLPFSPNGEKLASIAWRTWIYTDTGPRRTRLGYLRVGSVIDARGPLIKNAGCAGGWLRINPRGFVCLGKGATQDLKHPAVRASIRRPVRGEAFPYQYALSGDRPPERYFRLPSAQQLVEIEGEQVASRGLNWQARARAQGWWQKLDVAKVAPPYLFSEGRLHKPYGTKRHLERLVHAGQASRGSGFALVASFLHDERAYAVTTEMEMLALDRLELVSDSPDFSVRLEEGQGLPLAFHVKGPLTLWRRKDSGFFVPHSEQRERRGFLLTGVREKGAMLETSDGVWLAEAAVRMVARRESFPSVATGQRKWIDVSIQNQTLVAYEGRTPVYVTLISGGRGGLGDRGDDNPEGNKTVRGTFMIHEKSISSTMDGDEDRADNYDLQDVPFVQYFHRGFALHGAYWHDEFGSRRSHGCINLAARDAAWLFEWTDPQVPLGWHAALNKERGTVVHVRY